LVGVSPVQVFGEVRGDTLSVSLRDQPTDQESVTFWNKTLVQLRATLTDDDAYDLDSVRVQVRALDGEAEVSARAFLEWRTSTDIDASMTVFRASHSTRTSRVVDIVFGRFTIRDGMIVPVPLD
jgi:hypothetical protein